MMNRKTPDLENKLLILHAIDQLGPLTSLQLLQFLAEHDLTDYITMQLTLGDLLQTGHVQSIPHALGPLYTLTEEGRESLALFLRRLPHSIYSLVSDIVPRWKVRFQRETQMLADFHKREDGSYALRLRLMEKDAPLLDMTLSLPTRDAADRMSRRWPLAAPSFYGHLMQALGDDFSQDAQPPSGLIQCPSISHDCPQGCILRLIQGGQESPAFDLSLALPTEPMALFFAGRWEGKAEEICGFLMDRLSEE